MDNNIKILIADENHEFSRNWRNALLSKGVKYVDEASHGDEALTLIQNRHPDFVLVDIWLPKKDCIQLVNSVKELDFSPDNPPSFILLSMITNKNLFNEAIECGVDFCMTKPLDIDILEDRINRLHKNRRPSLITAGRNTLLPKTNDLETQVTSIIHQIGVPAHIKGYQYLRTAIIITIEDKDIIN